MSTAVVYNEAEVDFSGEMKTILEKFGAELEFYDNYWNILIISNIAVPLE